jgi:uncharacterized phage-associated protein
MNIYLQITNFFSKFDLIMADFTIDKEKSNAALLYIIQKVGGSLDMYSLLKILYFAESKHLVEYGRPITGDKMIAMNHGPVPSSSYDSVKSNTINQNNFSNEDNIVTAERAPNMDCLSESDIECLDESIAENSGLNFWKLKSKSHDSAYDWAIKNHGKNSTIPYMQIARAFGADEAMIEYIKTNSENQNCVF